MPARISKEQYRVLQLPIVALPSPQELFEQIVETLVAKGVAKYSDADPFRNSLPNGLFNLIPPRPTELDLNHLMRLIERNGEEGMTYLDPKKLTDRVVVPAGPYLILDIKHGGPYYTTPSLAEADILSEQRSPFTVFEGIIHGIVFSDVLGGGITCCGSRYQSECVPFLNLAIDEVVSPDVEEVHRVYKQNCFLNADSGDRCFGAASCGSRKGARASDP